MRRTGPVPTAERLSAEFRVHAASHAVPVLVIAAATVIGALCALLFQVLSARALGPEGFGLLAAFLAILNVAAIASSALQNSVAVATAEALAYPGPEERPRSRWVPGDATVLGIGGTVVVGALAPLLSRSLDTTVLMVFIAAASIPLSFWLSDAVGILQGTGKSTGAVAWTTVSMLARVALVLVAIALDLGIGGVLASVLLGTGGAALGAYLVSRRVPHPRRSVFTGTGMTVLLMTMCFAWMINADVIILRSTAPADVAGNYASAAILVKAAFMLPSTLSIYLLPRFVRNRDDRGLVRTGERLTIGVTMLSGIALALVFWLAGELVVGLVYGAKFDQSGEFLVPLALVYLPWITAQSVLIRLTADASRPAALVAAGALCCQAVGFAVVMPDVRAVMWVQAVLGMVVVAVFAALAWASRRSEPVGLEMRT